VLLRAATAGSLRFNQFKSRAIVEMREQMGDPKDPTVDTVAWRLGSNRVARGGKEAASSAPLLTPECSRLSLSGDVPIHPARTAGSPHNLQCAG